MPGISIVFPVWNEALRLPASLIQIRALADRLPGMFEFVFIVEKSTDSTLSILRAFQLETASIQLIEKTTQDGKGAAIQQGMQLARGQILFFSDIDLSCPLNQIQEFIRRFELDPDLQVLIGSRMVSGAEVNRPWWRSGVSHGFNSWVRLITGLPHKDTQCGFKAFRRSAALLIFKGLKSRGFEFDVELLLKAQGYGLKVAEAPVHWIYSKGSRVHPVRDVFKMFWGVLLFRLRR